MSGTAFNISMVFRAETASAKAGLSDITGGMRTVSTEADKVSAAVKKQAADLDTMAASTAKAVMAQQDLAAAERQAQADRARLTATFMAGMRSSETAAASLRDVVAGLNVTVGAQAQDMVEAARASAIYASALDDVRASFNPLFAASRQYEQQIERIAEAERLGAISAREAADARQRAASIIAPIGQRRDTGAAGSDSAYFAAQANDVMMMAILGQDAGMLAFQQGPQISQRLNELGGGTKAIRAMGAGIMAMMNPLSIATIGVIGLGAAAVQWFASSEDKAKSFAESVGDLSTQIDAISTANRKARTSMAELRAEFGDAAEMGRELYTELAEVERRLGELKLETTLKSLPEEFQTGLIDAALGPLATPKFQDVFDIGRFDGEGLRKASAVQGAADAVASADGLTARIAALEEYTRLYEEAAKHSGKIGQNEAEGLKAALELMAGLRRMQAVDENAAGKAKSSEIARDLERRAELERTILQYGAQSAEARAAENRQEREALQLRLEDLGITRQSAEGRRAIAALDELQAARDAAAREQRREYLRSQDDQIAKLRLEVSLIGMAKDEQTRVKALAEAELEIRDRNLGLLDGMVARFKAITAAEAENGLARKQALRDLQVQTMGDTYDVQIGLSRDPVSRANLEAQKEIAIAVAEGEAADIAAARAAQTRARSISDTIVAARTQIADMGDELRIRQQIDAQVATGAITSAEGNRLLREELELRPLIAAAARAEGAEKQQLLDVISGLRIAQEAMAAEERRLAQNDFLKDQAERIQQQRIELALVGATAAERARILAMVKAENEIRRLGMTGDAAEEVRRQAGEEALLAQRIEEQADAWARVQSAGEAAIDSVLDKLKDGDIKGALADFIGEIEKGFFDLAIRNPLKNAIFGTNLGTLDDIGGLKGIWDRLSGRNRPDEQGILGMASAPVQSMTIAAANVILNASSVLSGVAGMPANLNAAPGAFGASIPGALTGPADVQSMVWNFFGGKGLAPHQIAGIMGNASAESGFNPLAVGDNGNAHGLFQWNDRRDDLFDFIGGKGMLGDVQKQLEFAWHELMTSESGSLRQLMASTDVRGATEAFVGFERPQGYSAANPAASMHFDRRLAAAEQALSTFGTTAQTATAQLQQGTDAAGAGLDDLGKGMGQAGMGFGQLLGSIAGMIGGDAGSILTAGIGIIDQLGKGVPLFNAGGPTGGSDPNKAAGIVHEGEFVFDAVATRRIGVGNLEAIRHGRMPGFRDGGYVSRMPAMAAAANGNSAPSPGEGGSDRHFHFDLTGARGDREIEDLVRRGVTTALQAYNRDVLPRRVKEVVSDSRRVG